MKIKRTADCHPAAALSGSGVSCIVMITIFVIVSLLTSGCQTTNRQPPGPSPIEQAYLERLANWLNDTLPPEARYSAKLFLSEDIINQVLVGLRDAEIPLSTKKRTRFKISSVQTEFRDGFPMVKITGKVFSRDSNWSAEADTYAALEAIDEEQKKTPDQLEFKLHFYHLDEATVRYSSISLPLKGIIREIAEKKLIESTDGIKPFSLPAVKEWSFKIPNAPKALKINAPGGGSISLSFDQKVVDVRSKLSVDRVVFLRDGIHLLGNLILQLGASL